MDIFELRSRHDRDFALPIANVRSPHAQEEPSSFKIISIEPVKMGHYHITYNRCVEFSLLSAYDNEALLLIRYTYMLRRGRPVTRFMITNGDLVARIYKFNASGNWWSMWDLTDEGGKWWEGMPCRSDIAAALNF